MNLITDLKEETRYALMILTVAFGGLLFYANREKIQELEKEENKNPNIELAEKFPKISKIPLLRNLARWM